MTTNAVEEYNKFIPTRKASRGGSININDFTIYTNEIVFLEKGDYHSYTFPINRDYNTNFVENLVLSFEEGTYKAYLIRYDLNANEKSMILAGLPVDVSSKSSIQEIEDGDSIAGNISDGRTCWEATTTVEMCCHNVHSTFNIMAGEPCQCANPPTEYTMSFVQLECPESGGIGTGATGGTTTGGGGGGTGGGGGGGGGATVPVVVPPIDHISELNKLTKNKPDGSKTNIKQKIDDQLAALDSSPYEGGAMFNNNQEFLNPHIATPTSV